MYFCAVPRIGAPASSRAGRFRVSETKENDFRLWQLTVFKFAGDYLEKIVDALKAGSVVEQALLAQLVKGLNQIFVEMVISDDYYLYLYFCCVSR